MNFKMSMVELLSFASVLSVASAIEGGQATVSQQGPSNESMWLPVDGEVDLEGMHDQLAALAVSVPIEANTNGARRVLGDATMQRLCRHACPRSSSKLGDWALNPPPLTPNPNAAEHKYRAYIRTGTPRWLGTTRKTLGSKQVDQQELTNDLSTTSTSEVRLTNSQSSSVAISTSNTAETGVEMSIEVGIPELFKVTGKTSFTISTSHTRTQTDTKTSGSWNTVNVHVPPKSTACVTMEADHEVLEGDFEVDVCYDGYARCSFPDWQCNGHRFWFIPFRHIGRSRCKKIRGRMTANTYVHAKAHAYRGPCRRKLTDDIITGGAGLEVAANATGAEPNDRRLEAVAATAALHI